MESRSRCRRLAQVAVIGIVLFCVADAVCQTESLSGTREKPTMRMIIESSSFQHNGEIPPRHTCDGQNISPALSWGNVPAGTLSLALIVEDPDAPDPDAPRSIWVHWVL